MTIAIPRHTHRGDLLVTFGVLSDIHYSDKDTLGNRYYRDSDEKLSCSVGVLNSYDLDFVIECGDYIDHLSGTVSQAQTDLAIIEDVYETFSGTRYYVFGNHDLDVLDKEGFISGTAMSDAYYSFEVNNVYFIVLDTCFNSDSDDDPYSEGNYDWKVSYVPPNERTWLQNELDSAGTKDVIIFSHHRLTDEGGGYGIKNPDAVMSIINSYSGDIRMIFNGHYHQNFWRESDSSYHVTVAAIVEQAYPTTSFGIIYVYENSVFVNGRDRQVWYSN